jgi:hypothetical protein
MTPEKKTPEQMSAREHLRAACKILEKEPKAGIGNYDYDRAMTDYHRAMTHALIAIALKLPR